MTDREKLIEMLKSSKLCSKRFDDQYSDKTIAIIANHLLENGVIVPLVKVGDPLFTVAKIGVIIEHEVIQIRISDNGVVFDCISKTLHGKDFCFSNDLIGKTIFLTREEAEKALKEREQCSTKD